MKKKGFTLVELLAVIAILAILIIIVLPNIMALFNQAKQNSFENELKEIFKMSQKEWAIDSLTGTSTIVYARSNEKCTKELDLSGRTNVKYYVEVDKYGNVVKLFATDGTYQYEYRGDGLKVGEIKDSKQVASLENKAVLTLTCDGASKNGKDVTDGEILDGTNIGQNCSGNRVSNTIPSNATGLYKIMAEQAYLDNVKSEYVTSCSGVNFNEVSSDANGKGVYEIASTKDDKYPIYYYRGAVTNNNVKFGGFCWKAVRTTNTGGVKLIYNGTPDASGHCINTTGTNTQIKTSSYNINSYDSPAYVGYMYGTKDGSPTGTPYTITSKLLTASHAGIKFGKSVTYSGGKYTLTNTMELDASNYNQATSFNNNHYTCFSKSDTCETVYYVYYVYYNRGGSNVPITYYYHYISISGIDPNGGELIDVVKDSMFSNNRDSIAKIEIEKWYKDNMISYTSKIEDTIYCNDRSTSVKSGWNPNGGMRSYLYFSGYTRSYVTHEPSLACERANDKFTVSASIGNGKLQYPVGLLTADEVMYAGGRGEYNMNKNYYLYTKQNFWVGSPSGFYTAYGLVAYEFAMNSDGIVYRTPTNSAYGLRPVISISKNTSVSGGDGTANNPYVID